MLSRKVESYYKLNSNLKISMYVYLRDRTFTFPPDTYTYNNNKKTLVQCSTYIPSIHADITIFLTCMNIKMSTAHVDLQVITTSARIQSL